MALFGFAAEAGKPDDTSQRGKVRHRLLDCHRLLDLVRRRSYAITFGHEDLNDDDQRRHDPAMQTAAERGNDGKVSNG